MRTVPRSGWRISTTRKGAHSPSCRRYAPEAPPTERPPWLVRARRRLPVGVCCGGLFRGRLLVLLCRRRQWLQQLLERREDGGVLVVRDLELPAPETQFELVGLGRGVRRSRAHAQHQQRVRAVLAPGELDLEAVEGTKHRA